MTNDRDVSKKNSHRSNVGGQTGVYAGIRTTEIAGTLTCTFAGIGAAKDIHHCPTVDFLMVDGDGQNNSKLGNTGGRQLIIS